MLSFNRNELPVAPGSYILWLQLKRKRRITIGRLGEHLFPPGYYAYCGSAFGPGGLRARLSHHMRTSANPRWHIDYLKNIASLADTWYSTEPVNREHDFATTLAELPGAQIPIDKFGASDCNCQTHLVYFKAPAVLENGNLVFDDTQTIVFRRPHTSKGS